MILPNPDDYERWQDFANALLQVLTGGVEGSGSGAAYGPSITGVIPPASLPGPPAGYFPLYWSITDAQLFLANNFAVPPVVVTPFQIDTQSLALASVQLGQIADGAVGTNKLADLAVVNAKIANATILSAKIGDLQVITAKINDLAVNTAKIVDLAVSTAKINDLAVTTAKVGTAQIGTAQIANAAITSALILDATITTADIGNAQITTALIGTSQITSALILNATIVGADIANATILTANIGSAQITQALIATAAIGAAQIGALAVGTAAIQDLAVTSAKIATLLVNKLASGTLGASIDVSGGSFKFTTGAHTLYIGNGFGTSGQFFIWYGSTPASISACAEAGATFYLKTNGSAYFGGSLSAGVLRTTAQTTDSTTGASVTIGDFASNGGAISSVISYDYYNTFACNHGTGSVSGSGTAALVLEASNNSGTSWTTLSTLSVGITGSVVTDPDPSVQDIVTVSGSGGVTVLWTPGALTTLRLRARLTSRSLPTATGTTVTGYSLEQVTAVSSTE